MRSKGFGVFVADFAQGGDSIQSWEALCQDKKAQEIAAVLVRSGAVVPPELERFAGWHSETDLQPARGAVKAQRMSFAKQTGGKGARDLADLRFNAVTASQEKAAKAGELSLSIVWQLGPSAPGLLVSCKGSQSVSCPLEGRGKGKDRPGKGKGGKGKGKSGKGLDSGTKRPCCAGKARESGPKFSF